MFALAFLTQADVAVPEGFFALAVLGPILLLLLFFIIFVAKRYKRCPSNKILVIYGRVGANQAARCLHGGGKFVLPLIQDHAYLNLEPMVIDIPLEGALSLNNIRVNVPATFTVGISTDPVLMNLAAERLLLLPETKIQEQAQDIILGQLRLVIATLSIEEINKDREKFMNLINENVAEEINKVGLSLINVNIRDITDESGYIEAIGKRAAAEAINRAKVEVAQQERDGATGQKDAERDQRVRVAELEAVAIQGEVKSRRDYEVATAEREAETVAAKKKAEQEQRIQVAAAESEAVKGEVSSKRDAEVATAERAAETVAATKRAEQEQRIQVADAESMAVQGENKSRAQIAESNASLAEVRAGAKRRADIAAAAAEKAIYEVEKEQELARLAKEELARQEIEKQRVEIEAEATAERARREARGQADAILAKYIAEAEGTQKVLEAKAAGYRRLVDACRDNPQMASTLLMIEQLPALVAEQVKAIQNLKIDKITVWDSGSGGRGADGGSTANFLASLIGSLPAMHDLAEQAGIELPTVLGRVEKTRRTIERIAEAEVADSAD